MTEFKSNTVTRDKEGHYTVIKMSIYQDQDDRTIRNIYAPNIRALKYIKEALTNLKGEIDSNAKWDSEVSFNNGEITQTENVK